MYRLGHVLITNRKQKMAVHGSEKSLSRATSLKEEGNKNFRQGNLNTAVDYYTQVSYSGYLADNMSIYVL